MKLFYRVASKTTFRISAGKASLVKGQFSNRAVREISLLCSELGIDKGELWLGADRKLRFSSEFDKKYYQRFRNIIFSGA